MDGDNSKRAGCSTAGKAKRCNSAAELRRLLSWQHRNRLLLLLRVLATATWQDDGLRLA
jgi:hypothetical protein